jgi:D-inositol-3-phosphate glycosyltransferase
MCPFYKDEFEMNIIMVDASIGNDYTVLLCNSLVEKGNDVTLVAPENKNIEIPHNFKVLKWSPSKDKGSNKLSKGITYLRYFKKLFRLIRKTENPSVHYQFFRRRDEILFSIFLRLTGTKLFYTAHNVLPHEHKKIDYQLQKMVYNVSEGIIAHSDFIKRKIITDFNISPHKIAVIPHGNFDIYLPEKPVSRSEAREQLNIKKNEKVILFFGGIREYKGLDILLDAFKLIKDEDNYKLIIAGAPQTKALAELYQKKISSITTNGRISSKFDFIPADDVASYFISSDVLILPYKNIYHSGVVHLAYSFGKPIIATRVGDFDESIEHGKSGLLLDENTADDLAQKIREYFNPKNNIEQMGRYAKELSDSKYSWENVAEMTNNLYGMN